MTPSAPDSASLPAVRSARRIVVVAHPKTRVRAEAIATALAEWRPGNHEIRVRFTTLEVGAYLIAKEERDRADIIVAAGGDGTVGEVASAIAHSDTLLGIIPVGSTNIVARELGIPADPSAAMDLITSDFDVVTLDIGWAGERAMLHMAGTGFDSRLFAGTKPERKRRYGWLAYLPSAARALLAKADRYHIVADGERFQVTSPLVLVANGGTVITPRWRVHPRPRKDDGLLELIIVTANGTTAILRTLARALLGQLDRSPFVISRSVKRVRIESDQPVPVQIDGDVAMTTPVTITVDPAAVRVIVPKAAAAT